MKFINKYTGAILEPSSDFVKEQLKKSTKYKELKEVKKKKPVKK